MPLTSDNFSKVFIDLENGACRPEIVYERLALLAFPAAGFDCLALGLVALAAAAVLTLRRPVA